MKSLLLLFCLPAIALGAGPFSVGLRVGAPFNHVVEAVGSGIGALESGDRKLVIGPTAELHLPFGFSVSIDALYRNAEYRAPLVQQVLGISGNQWEFPVLAKYRFSGGLLPIKPFVGAGVSFRHLSDLSLLRTPSSLLSTSNTIAGDNSRGFVASGGVEIKLLVVRIAPELRFTHWGAQSLGSGLVEAIRAKGNQGEILLGITF